MVPDIGDVRGSNGGGPDGAERPPVLVLTKLQVSVEVEVSRPPPACKLRNDGRRHGGATEGSAVAGFYRHERCERTDNRVCPVDHDFVLRLKNNRVTVDDRYRLENSGR